MKLRSFFDRIFFGSREREPANMASLTWGSESITGNFRDNNEDRCLTDPQGRFFFVCDGLGGQAAGERASQMGIEEVAKKLNQSLDFATANLEQVRTCIDAAVNQANSEIMALASVDASMHNMGSTIVMLVAAGGSCKSRMSATAGRIRSRPIRSSS